MAKRTREKIGKKHYYVERIKKRKSGKTKKRVVNIGRSIAVDTRKRARKIGKKTGYGHQLDYAPTAGVIKAIAHPIKAVTKALGKGGKKGNYPIVANIKRINKPGRPKTQTIFSKMAQAVGIKERVKARRKSK